MKKLKMKPIISHGSPPRPPDKPRFLPSSFSLLPLFIILCSLFIVNCESTVLENNGNDENPLVAPRAVQITALDKSLMANWTRIAAAQGVDPVYEIWYGTDSAPDKARQWGEGWEHDDTNLVSVRIEELENGITYYVWVKAVYGEMGASDFSPISYGVPVPPPAAPSPAVAGGEGLLEVSWEADEYAYFYEVSYGASGGSEPPSGTEKRTVADPPVVIGGRNMCGTIITGLENSVYTVWVKAVNTAGESAWARASGSPQTETAAPETPARPAVTPGNKKLTASWPASARAAGYKLYYGTTDNFSAAAPYSDSIAPCFGTVSEEVILPANGTAYYLWVKAYNSRGESAQSPSASGKPEAPAPIDFNDIGFRLGTAQAEYIFSETNPPGPFNTSGQLWDRLTRRKETALGNLFCDGAAWYVRTKHNETFDFVFLNGGYLDQPLNKGAITVGSIESIPPPASRDDYYTIITLRGPELKLLLDQAARVRNMGRGGKNTGAWGMVSSEARYTIKYPDRGSTTNLELFFTGIIKEGSVTINGAPPDFSETKTYRVCTANYLAAGGDGYTAFVIALRDYPGTANVKNITVPVWQGVSEYIYDKGKITPYLDARVKQEGGGVMCE
jgi:hypothetical protein